MKVRFSSQRSMEVFMNYFRCAIGLKIKDNKGRREETKVFSTEIKKTELFMENFRLAIGGV
jgi:DNA helicase TIP49 (TBP-interacting protein)